MSRNYLSIIILIIALSGTAFFTWPKYQQLEFLREDILARETELRSKNEYFDDIKRIFEELKAYEESLGKISSAMPADPLLPATFNFIQNTASQSGLILEEVQAGGITTFDGKPVIGDETSAPRVVKAISLTISLAGSYDSLKSFLAEAEQSARIIEIKNIGFASSKEDEPFSFKLDILVYYY